MTVLIVAPIKGSKKDKLDLIRKVFLLIDWKNYD